MAFDWKKFQDELQGEPDWDDPQDLARLSMESFVAQPNIFRRDASSGLLRLAGAGITGSAGSIDGVAETLHNFQKFVLATGMSLNGHKSLQGPAPADIVSKTRLNLNGAPLPGSLVLRIVPAMPPSEEIAPAGQRNLLGETDTQLVDQAMKEAMSLLREGKQFGVDSESSQFIQRLDESGPRVASALRHFAEGLANYEFEPSLTWLQPRHPRVRTALNVSELTQIRDAIESNELEREPTTIRGILKTVSEIGPWQVETAEKQRVKINARDIPASATSTLRTGMLISVEVNVVEKSGPASSVKTEYTATSFRVLDSNESA